jgi:hypothetical protein
MLDFLSNEEIATISNFLSYGSLHAPVWFIGIEEDLGQAGSHDIVKNLKARGSFAETVDLYKAHCRLQKHGQPIDIETKPPSGMAVDGKDHVGARKRRELEKQRFRSEICTVTTGAQ